MIVKEESQMKHTKLLAVIFISVTLPFNSACTDGNKIVDLCDGTREFLSIPDSADIIFTAGIYGEDINSPTEVYAMDIDNRIIFRISCSNYNGLACTYSGPHASPDRKKVVVMRGCSDTNSDGFINFLDNKSIWVIDLESDTAKEITGFSAVNSPDWSANNEIIFAANQPGTINTDIFKMDEHGENIQNLTNTNKYFENDPSWSEDGKQIAYNMGEFVTPEGLAEGSFIAAIGDLWVMDNNGDNKKKVVSFDGDENCSDYSDNFCQGLPADPAFMPDGNSIVYEKLLSTAENNGSGCWNIFSASLSGLDHTIINLTNNATAYQVVPHASEEGIIFHEVDVDKPFYGLVMINLDGSNRKIIIDNSNCEYYLGAASWL